VNVSEKELAVAVAEERTLVRLDPDWELWAIENLMAGAPRRDVIAALVDEGIDGELAKTAIETLMRREAVVAQRQRGDLLRRTAQALVLERRLRGPLVVDAVESEDASTFRDRRIVRRAPVLFTHAFRAMRAMSWNLDRMAHDLGHVQVDVNTGRTQARQASSVEREQTAMPLRDFIGACRAESTNAHYIVSKNGLLQNPGLKPFVDDLTPLPEVLDGRVLPRFASLWVGPAGTFTRPHFDPHHAFLVMIEGRKRVRLSAPDQPALFEGMDGYFARHSLVDEAWRGVPGFDPAGVAEVEIGPGQGLFIPVGFWHEVVGLEPSMMVSFLCFREPNDFHWLAP
jgi:hypothetical protein